MRSRRGSGLRWGAAVVLALVVAEGAVLALTPRDGIIEPAQVQAQAYFSAGSLARAEAFRGPQRLLGIGALAVEAAVLALLVWRPPGVLARATRRPLLRGAAAGAALSAVVALAPLPLRLVARERSKDVGLVTQDWLGFVGDLVLSTAIGAAIAAVLVALALALMRRFPRGWWIGGAAAVVLVGAGLTYATPVVLDPLFNRFDELPAGRRRSDVLELARRAGVEVGKVQVIDASRRTSAANAYVAGLGATKRVVLYDTLLDSFSRQQTRLVVAHELGHVHHRDVEHGLLYLLLVAPAGVFAIAVLTRRLAPPAVFAGPGERPGPAVVPALALSLLVIATAVTWISNGLSRDIEARADAYSLRLTGQTEPFIGFERRLALRNVSDPDPPGLLHGLLGTHPTTLERIGIGVAYERGER